MRIALDSNVLLYWLGLARKSDDLTKIERAQAVVPMMAERHTLLVPGQVLGEAYNVLTRSGQPRERARLRLTPVLDAYELLSPAVDTYTAALELAATHKLQFWDALIISIAAEAGCDLLLSEDMQDGFSVGGLRIANPFATTMQSRLADLLGD